MGSNNAGRLGEAGAGGPDEGQERADEGGTRGADAPPQGSPRIADGARRPKKSRGLLREGPPVKFAWIQTEKDAYPLSKLCRWLEVTPSGFYARSQRPQSMHGRE